MTIETKFNLGDTVHTIKGSRHFVFVVKTISCTEDGVEYSEDIYPTFPEDACFATRQELCDFIMKE